MISVTKYCKNFCLRVKLGKQRLYNIIIPTMDSHIICHVIYMKNIFATAFMFSNELI